MTEKTKERLNFALRLLVTLTLLPLALHFVKFDSLAASFMQADWGWLGVAACLFTSSGFAGALSWFLILRRRLPALRFRTVAGGYWIGMFFNNLMPSNIGGDLFKVYFATRWQAVGDAAGTAGATPVSFFLGSVVLDRIVNFGVLVFIGVFATLWHVCGFGCALLSGIALIAPLPICVPIARRWVRHRPGWAARWPWLLDSLRLFADRRRLPSVLLAAALSQGLKVWCNVFLLRSLALEMPPSVIWRVIPMFGIVSALPVSIGGLGIREMAAHWLAGRVAVDSTRLVTLSLAGHLLTLAVNLLGALPLLHKVFTGSRRGQACDSVARQPDETEF